MVGVLGGVHCIGMCGGIVSALTFSLPARQRSHLPSLLPLLLAYNTGRISGYMVVGALGGGLGAAFLSLSGLDTARHLLQIIGALFMLALGLYLAGIWSGLSTVEKAGRILWRRIEPLGRRLMPVNSVAKALPLGFIWGWLPCGLVYSMVIWTLSAGSAWQGALLMLAFGLGTLPLLFFMGTTAAMLARFTRHTYVKRLAGLSIVALGLLQLWRAFV